MLRVCTIQALRAGADKLKLCIVICGVILSFWYALTVEGVFFFLNTYYSDFVGKVLFSSCFDCTWNFCTSFLVSYREGFKDLPFERIGSADSIQTRVQLVSSMNFEVRVILLTLGMTLYHNGKFPKNKKTVGLEYVILCGAFPQVCEGITEADLISAHERNQNIAGLIRSLGIVYVIHGQFCMAVIQALVQGNRGWKRAPSDQSIYKRMDPVFTKRQQSSATGVNFQLSGAGFLDYQKKKNSSSDTNFAKRHRRKISRGKEGSVFFFNLTLYELQLFYLLYLGEEGLIYTAGIFFYFLLLIFLVFLFLVTNQPSAINLCADVSN